MNSPPMLHFIQENQMIPPQSTVFLGVSGGADSICLLHQLYHLRDVLDFQLVALHFNHQLRGEESQRDQDFVARFVSEFCPEVSLLVDTAPVAALAAAEKVGVEEMARRCRYDFFHRCASGCGNSRIATAHNANDNGETVIMNLTRGAGLRGLAGIPPVRSNIIRPLLTTTRGEIETYLTQNALPHVEDSSNGDHRYTRNRIRHQVMPVLMEQNPSFLDGIASLTPILREEDALLTQLALDSLPPTTDGDGTISISAGGLSALPRPLALRGIQLLAERLDPSLVLELGHRTDILSLCRGEHPSASITLPRGLTARRAYDTLVLTTATAPALEEAQVNLPCEISCGDYQISISSGIYQGEGTPWDFWILSHMTPLTLRPRREGDRLGRPNRTEKTIKSLMIDEKIPRHLRDSLPVFTFENQVVAALGLGVHQSALPQVGGQGWHIIIQKV